MINVNKYKWQQHTQADTCWYLWERTYQRPYAVIFYRSKNIELRLSNDDAQDIEIKFASHLSLQQAKELAKNYFCKYIKLQAFI